MLSLHDYIPYIWMYTVSSLLAQDEMIVVKVMLCYHEELDRRMNAHKEVKFKQDISWPEFIILSYIRFV